MNTAAEAGGRCSEEAKILRNAIAGNPMCPVLHVNYVTLVFKLISWEKSTGYDREVVYMNTFWQKKKKKLIDGGCAS